ncbi:MAG: RNA polymerase subunit sigma-24 [Verrucomicrobiota bacterium]
MIPRSTFLLALLCALNFCPSAAVRADSHKDAMAGRHLKPEEIPALEAAVAKQPDDVSARTKLLGYYFYNQHGSKAVNALRLPHILWIITNQPAVKIAGLPYCHLNPVLDADAYVLGKKLWLEQAKAWSTNPAVLANAANYLQIADPDLAGNLLQQAQKIDPANPKWSDQLGHLYALNAGTGKTDPAKSLAAFQRAQAADTDADSRFYRLSDLALQAFAAGDLKNAEQYAGELLATATQYPKDWNYGNAILMGNTVLGRIALRQGQVKAAKEYLFKAGQTPGSPQLNSFGPNMSLAKELAEKGEQDAVIKYFDQCRKFWSMGADKLDAWTKTVKAGRVPDFGANLVY